MKVLATMAGILTIISTHNNLINDIMSKEIYLDTCNMPHKWNMPELHTAQPLDHLSH